MFNLLAIPWYLSSAVRPQNDPPHIQTDPHGHVHEYAGADGEHCREKVGKTPAMAAASGGPELALVRFDPEPPVKASRTLMVTGGGVSGPGP